MRSINVNIAELIPTEEIITQRIPVVLKHIGLNTNNWPPIIISEQMFILDGHHRYHIALAHSFEKIPAHCLSYSDETVKVFDYSDGTQLDKTTLIKIYESGVLLKPKTTRHIIGI